MPRFGPAPATAARAGVAVWTIGVLLPTMVWMLVIHLPTQVIVMDMAASLFAVVLSTMAGAWLYQE